MSGLLVVFIKLNHRATIISKAPQIGSEQLATCCTLRWRFETNQPIRTKRNLAAIEGGKS